MHRALRIVMAAGMGLAAFGACAQDGAGRGAPEAGAADPAGPIRTADELLAALEHSGEGLRALEGDINYVKEFGVLGDDQVRRGKLFFESEPPAAAAPPKRKFAVEFNSLRVGRRMENIRELYIFDGQWLVEKDFQEKQFTKRQVAAPGAAFDPLRLGEGPLPIPIGQKKADILERYTAELLPAADGLQNEHLLRHVEGSHQLRLVPRPERAEEDKFAEIRLWYRRDAGGDLLPVLARTVTATDDPAVEGDVAVVQLLNVRINGEAAIPAGALDTTTPAADMGWNVRIDEWEDAREGRR
jgi:hypothetical protein